MLDLEPAAREMARLVAGTDDRQLDDPTPCEGLCVAALLDHIAGLCLAFTGAARKAPPGTGDAATAGPGGATAEALPPEWRSLIPHRLDALVEAWRDPAAWDGMAEAGGVTMPAHVLGLVALDELVLHGWDLARATRQPFTCDDASTAAVLEFTTTASQPEHAAGRDGLFGPVLPVPQDAPPLDRALGLAGRDPAWAR